MRLCPLLMSSAQNLLRKEQDATYVKNMKFECQSLHFLLASASGASAKPQTQWGDAGSSEGFTLLSLLRGNDAGWVMPHGLPWLGELQ